MKCDQCGNSIEEEWVYCPVCSATIDFAEIKKAQKSREIESEREAEAEAEANDRAEERTKVVNWIMKIAAVLMFGFLLEMFLGRIWLYIICFLVAVGGVVRGLISPPQSRAACIFFVICIVANIAVGIGTVLFIAHWITTGIIEGCQTCLTCGQR